MKIVFVVPDMPGGGTEKVVSLLANEYARQGIGTAVMMFAGEVIDYPMHRDVEVISAGKPSGGSVKIRLSRLRMMRNYFKKNRDAYIFSFSTIGTGFIVMSTLGLGRKMLVSERTDPNTCDHKLYRNLFYRFAGILVCQTQAAVESFPKYLQKKAVVIPNPIDADLPPPYQGERKRRIVTAGRLAEVKNHRLLIDAFLIFGKKYDDYVLDIYGKGELEQELKKYSRSTGLSGRVHFHGFCPDVHKEIHDASMFVLSSDYEGVSNSMTEAMAMGIPVIATDCPPGGCRAYIHNGVNGLLVPTGDKRAMAKAMQCIAGDKVLADAISRNGAGLRDRYPVDRVAGEMLNRIREWASHKGRIS